jgi:hypothetical protein
MNIYKRIEMRKMLFGLLFVGSFALYGENAPATNEVLRNSSGQDVTLTKDTSVILSVVGQGLPPEEMMTAQGCDYSPKAAALAKRAAIADGYRLMAEKYNGVKIEGRDTVRNMAISKSEVRTLVSATLRKVDIVKSIWKDCMFQVEMELKVNGSDYY